MSFLRSSMFLFFAAILLLVSPAVGGDKKPSSDSQDSKPAASRMDKQTRMMVIRGLTAEIAFARRSFPLGKTGLTIKDGKVSPDDNEIQALIAGYGPSLKPGDRALITNVIFKGDDKIIFEINGGPMRKQKWWEHIQIGGMGGTVTPGNPDDPKLNSRGSFVVLAFDKYVPELNPDQIKKLLYPALDFTSKSPAEAFAESLPPKLKNAIKDHQVLVGMNRDMVVYAKGRPPQKYRDKDGGTDYEEWIYGQPPQEVEFVRFVGDEVVRVEIMKVNGEKIVRTEKEIDINKPTVAEQQPPAGQPGQPGQSASTGPATPPAQRPTLRRPGEDAPPVDPGNTPRMPMPTDTGPQQGPPGAPGNIPQTGPGPGQSPTSGPMPPQ